MENNFANQVQHAAAKWLLDIAHLAGRRVSCDKSGSAFTTPDTYANLYNARSELTNATSAVDAAYRYGYDFDDIGNRKTSAERGANVTYAVNHLNQYTEISNSTVQPSTFNLSLGSDGTRCDPPAGVETCRRDTLLGTAANRRKRCRDLPLSASQPLVPLERRGESERKPRTRPRIFDILIRNWISNHPKLGNSKE